jgi:acyl-ACP thioesterase
VLPSAAPAESRTFTAQVLVRLGDVSPKGRLRLDGIARILQDVAVDDATDAAPGEDAFWVVRRTTVEVAQWPRHREELTVTTWCSGYGRRWALRRTSLAGARGGRVETESLWIHIDPETGRPTPMGELFFTHWAEGITDTSVSARRRLPDAPSEAVSRRPWPLRFTDFDGLAHVNNAAYWAPVEEELGGRDGPEPPLVAEIEFRDGVVRGDPVELVVHQEDDGFRLWWVVRGQGRASVRVQATV